MTSSNGNFFRVTGPLWGESTGDRWIPFTKAGELWCFLWSAPGDLRHHHAHYDVTVVGNGHLECPVARHNVETQMSFWKKFRHLLQRKQLSFWQLILEQWWRHQMELFSALLAIWGGNSPVTGEFPAQRSVTRSFDAFFDLRLNKSLSEQSWGWWFETPWRPLWRRCNALQCFRVSVCSSLMCNRTPGRCFEKEKLHP